MDDEAGLKLQQRFLSLVGLMQLSLFSRESSFIESVHLLSALRWNMLLIFDGTRIAGVCDMFTNSFIATRKLHLVSFQEKSVETTRIYTMEQPYVVFPVGILPKC